MIPKHIHQSLFARGYSLRTDDKDQIRKSLARIGINPESEVGSFYLDYDPSLLQSDTSHEQLEDVIAPTIDGHPRQIEPRESPVEMVTKFVREVWETPENLFCLTTTEGEGAYLCDLKSGVVYDFSLAQQAELVAGTLAPRWKSFFEFLEWYLS